MVISLLKLTSKSNYPSNKKSTDEVDFLLLNEFSLPSYSRDEPDR